MNKIKIVIIYANNDVHYDGFFVHWRKCDFIKHNIPLKRYKTYKQGSDYYYYYTTETHHYIIHPTERIAVASDSKVAQKYYKYGWRIYKNKYSINY